MLRVFGMSLLALALGFPAHGASGQETVVGDQCPLVSGLNQDGKEWKLAAATRQESVLLYFYPKDESPVAPRRPAVCATAWATCKKPTWKVVGVSFDTAASHKNLIAKHNLNFSVDRRHRWKSADTYGVRMVDKAGRDA